jgi:hypothetical protein
MLKTVAIDLVNFLFFFVIVVFSFGVVLAIILKKVPDAYNDIDYIGYMTMALRKSIADSDTSEFIENSNYKILAWLVWLVIIFFGNIVFMNFIIAVVG